MPLSLDLCHGLDPVGFARERLRFQPDSVQARILTSQSKQVILNCTRQWGKSTLTAAQAVFTAWHEPESLILVMSPTARQSAELVRKAGAFLSRLGVRPRRDGGNTISRLLPNGSRIVGLPGAEAIDRGFPGVRLLLVDEVLVSIRTFTSPCSPSSPSVAEMSGSSVRPSDGVDFFTRPGSKAAPTGIASKSLPPSAAHLPGKPRARSQNHGRPLVSSGVPLRVRR